MVVEASGSPPPSELLKVNICENVLEWSEEDPRFVRQNTILSIRNDKNGTPDQEDAGLEGLATCLGAYRPFETGA